jgi:AcrR family transcriptional regulator
MTAPTLKAQQAARTRAVLIAVARRLFSERGYGAVSAEEIAVEAGVTTGALYHQFKSKRDVFQAAFESVEAELAADASSVVERFPDDPWAGFIAACDAFLDACMRPEIRQIVVIDGLSVLGAQAWRDVMARYALGLTTRAVEAVANAGVITAVPPAAMGHLILGILEQAAIFIATAPESRSARAEAGVALRALLEGLRV